MSKLLFTKLLPLLTLCSLSITAQSMEIEDVDHLFCSGQSGSEKVVIYLTGLSPVEDEHLGNFNSFRRAHFVLSVADAENPELNRLSSHGTGKLQNGMTKAKTFSYQGKSSLSHLPNVNLVVRFPSDQSFLGFVTLENGTYYKNLKCRIGLR